MHRHTVCRASGLGVKQNSEKQDPKVFLQKSDYKFSELFLKSTSCAHLYCLGNICSERGAEPETEFQTQRD